MIELSAWDTLLYTFVIITLMVVLSRLLTEQPPALRIRDNKVGSSTTELLPGHAIVLFRTDTNGVTPTSSSSSHCIANLGLSHLHYEQGKNRRYIFSKNTQHVHMFTMMP